VVLTSLAAAVVLAVPIIALASPGDRGNAHELLPDAICRGLVRPAVAAAAETALRPVLRFA